jgi:amino acid transporter
MAKTVDSADIAGQPALKRVIGRGMLLCFVVGDIFGAGIYALVGKVAGHVGGMLWLPFLLAFALASLTAAAYAELASKYSRASGAALYVHQAFGLPFVTFIVAFAVMMSGVTSASAAARAFGGSYLAEFVTPAGARQRLDLPRPRHIGELRWNLRVRQSQCSSNGHRGVRLARHHRHRHLRAVDGTGESGSSHRVQPGKRRAPERARRNGAGLLCAAWF